MFRSLKVLKIIFKTNSSTYNNITSNSMKLYSISNYTISNSMKLYFISN